MSDFPINLDPQALPQVPVPEPDEIRAGDTVSWQRQFDRYPPGSGFSLSYIFLGQSAGYPVGGSMVANGPNNFVVTVPAATTAAWQPGSYRWQAYIHDANGNRYTVAEGITEILPNLENQTSGLDDREPDEKILDAIISMLSGKASQDAQEYEIAGRRLNRYSWTELMRMRSTYEKRVRAIRIRRGEIPPTQTIGVLFRNGY
ncbi:hypothetical protein [Silvibacterium acidisoli]|uniref:hypothetical protein n=1 Tax=Acidobacteriaceae bacterium ZG23-2 TaxID=2883246 RepID=UPI00406BE23A